VLLPLKTFIIYARADEAHKNQLLLHLRPLTNSGLIAVWHDGNIQPGEAWEKRIEAELDQSDLVLLLVSANSLNSDFIQYKELQTALDRLRRGVSRVVPVIVSHCAWKYDQVLSGLQAEPLYLSQGPMAVEDPVWTTHHQAWTRVVESVGELSAQLRAEKEADIQRQEAETEKHERAVADQARLHRAAAEEQQRQLEARRAQDADWQVACAQNTLAGYEAFLKKWPNSAYATDARRFIRLLRKAEKPPIQWTRYAGIGGTALAASSVLFVWWLNPSGCTTGSPSKTPDKAHVITLDTKNNRVDPIMGTLVFVKGGTFTMGCMDGRDSECYDNEKPAHEVTLRNFYMAETEVTQKQWRAVTGNTPSHFKDCDNCPVEQVSWNDIQEFLQKLNAMSKGIRYRLPTEAEWEYAARGGARSGNYQYAGSNNLTAVAQCDGNAEDKTHPLKGLSPNELGLYDMSGNVLEWCADWFDDYPEGPIKNPTGPPGGSYRVLRGGSWGNSAGYCRVSRRDFSDPGYRGSDGGFRVAASSQ
jgi:formylglycine-generating enzyme required for sulfatase activity